MMDKSPKTRTEPEGLGAGWIARGAAVQQRCARHGRPVLRLPVSTRAFRAGRVAPLCDIVSRLQQRFEIARW